MSSDQPTQPDLIPGGERQRQRIIREARLAQRRFNASLVQSYEPVAARVFRAYERTLPRLDAEIDVLTRRLNAAIDNDNDDEAARLGETRAALEQFRRGVAQQLDDFTDAINADLAGLEAAGIEAGARVAITNLRAGGVNVGWGIVPIETLQEAASIVDSDAFRQRLADMGAWHADAVSDIVLAAGGSGQNPNATATLIRDYFQGSQRPLQDATRWARTTQVYAARRATRTIYEASGVQQWMWSASLDNRTCLACIAMHGTVHPVSETLNDHHNGRCAMVPITPAWFDLGMIDESGIIKIESGIDWFNRLDANEQRERMGPELYQAWRSGRVNFDAATIVGEYDNDVFGTMRRRRTNTEIGVHQR